MNPYVDESDLPTEDDLRRARELKLAQGFAAQRNPDIMARALRVAGEQGITVPAAAAAEPPAFSWDELRHTAPVLSKFLVEDLNRAAAIGDDAEHLGTFEKWFGGWQDMAWAVPDELDRTKRMTERGNLGWKILNGQGSAEDQLRVAALDKEDAEHPPVRMGYVPGVAPATMQAVGQQLSAFSRHADTIGKAAFIGGLTGAAQGMVAGPAGGGVGFAKGFFAGAGAAQAGASMYENGILEGGNAFLEYLKIPGVTEDEARVSARAVALFNGAIEGIEVSKVIGLVPGAKALAGHAAKDGIGRMLRSTAGRAVIARLAARVASVGLWEGFQEFAQEFMTVYEGIRAGGAGSSEALSQALSGPNLERELEAGIGGIQMGFGMGAGNVAARTSADVTAMRDAQRRVQLFEALGDIAANSKTRERLPEVMQAYVHEVQKEHGGKAPEAVSAPAGVLRKLFQEEGLSDEWVEKNLPEVARQLRQAGDDQALEVAIPLPSFAAHIAPLAGYKTLHQDLRVGEGMTLREAKAAEQRANEIGDEADAAAENPEAEKSPAVQVYEQVKRMSMDLGHDEGQARKHGTLWASVMESRGQRTGKTALEYFATVGLQVEHTELDSAQLDAFKTETTKRARARKAAAPAAPTTIGSQAAPAAAAASALDPGVDPAAMNREAAQAAPAPAEAPAEAKPEEADSDKPPSGMTPKQFKAWVKAHKERVDARVKALAESGQPGLQFATKYGATLAVTKDTRTGGEKWRVTTIGKDGVPSGHVEADTMEAAIREARGMGGDLFAEQAFEGEKDAAEAAKATLPARFDTARVLTEEQLAAVQAGGELPAGEAFTSAEEAAHEAEATGGVAVAVSTVPGDVVGAEGKKLQVKAQPSKRVLAKVKKAAKEKRPPKSGVKPERFEATKSMKVAPAAEDDSAAPIIGGGLVGNTGVLVTPQRTDGEAVVYAIVDAGALVPSHDPISFTPSEAYPAGVQEREYHRQQEEKDKVVRGAKALAPAFLLADTPSALDGPPIVTAAGKDGKHLVVGGNGRTMMVQRAQREGGLDAYRKALVAKAEAFGFNPARVEEMEAPVLVRVLPELRPSSPQADLVAAVRRTNEGMTQALSPAARAVAEAKALTPEALEAIGAMMAQGEGTLRELLASRPAEVRAALQAAGIITPQNRSEWMAGAHFTDAAKDRLEGMFLGRIIGSGDRLAKTAPSMLRKLERLVPALIRVEGVNPDASEIPTIQAALDQVNEAAGRGITLDEQLGQVSMFGGEEAPPAVQAMARLLEGTGQKALAAKFKVWASQAGVDPAQGAMFGGSPGDARRELLGHEGAAKVLFQKLDRKNLLVQHNLTAENLIHADELGGLAMPSLAISKDEHPLQQFGEITLLARPELVDPKRTPVFDADAYSPRHPDVKHRLNPKPLQAIERWLAPYLKRIDQGYFDTADLRENGLERIIDSRGDGSALKLAFLEEVKGVRVPDYTRDAPIQYRVAQTQAVRDFVKQHGELPLDHDSEAHKGLSDAIWAGIEELAGGDEDLRASQVGQIFGGMWDSKTSEETLAENPPGSLVPFGRVDAILRDFHKVGQRVVDWQKVRDEVEHLINRHSAWGAEYQAWAKEKLQPTLGKPYIRAWSDTTGDERRIPYTLENVVRHMKKDGVRGGEGHNYGLGTARAHGAKQFRSMSGIQAERDRLVPYQEVEEAKKALNDRFEKLSEVEGFSLDELSELMIAAYKQGLGRAIAARGWAVSQAGRTGIQQLMDDLVAAPTDYFEAKPKRGVGLNEFVAAVVPSDVDPRARAILERHGLKVYEYGAPERSIGTESEAEDREADRREVIAAAAQTEKILFQPAFHGTAVRGIDRFSTQYVGTGQGAASYGWGLYFAEAQQTAEAYRRELAHGSQRLVVRGKVVESLPVEIEGAAMGLASRMADGATAAEALAATIKQARFMLAESKADREHERAEWNRKSVEWLEGLDASELSTQAAGQIYGVEVPEKDQLLDWDKPLAEQPDFIKEKLRSAGIMVTDGKSEYAVPVPGPSGVGYTASVLTGQGFYRDVAEILFEKANGHPINTREERVESYRLASMHLKSLGIDGLKYLDSESRSPAAHWTVQVGAESYNFPDRAAAWAYAVAAEEKGLDPKIVKVEAKRTHNFVVWTEEAVRVERTLYQKQDPGPALLVDLKSAGNQDQILSAAIRQEAKAQEYARRGINVVVPVPRSFTRSLAQFWVDVTSQLNVMGDQRWVAGVTPEDAVEVVRAIKPSRVHIIGMRPSGKEYAALAKRLQQEVPGIELVTTRYDEAALRSRQGSMFDAPAPAEEKPAAPAPARGPQMALFQRQDQDVEAHQALEGDSFALFQTKGGKGEGADTHRGSVSFDEATRDYFRITLTGKANLSTFLHESGHVFLELLRRDAEGGHAESQADLAVLEKWAGVTEGGKWSDSQLEHFARAFEAYLREGKAPSSALAEAFTAFKVWLTHIYRSVFALNVELTDDVRGVMDRLVATDEAIAKAQQENQLLPMFQGAEKEGLDEKEGAKLARMYEAAVEAGRADLLRDAMRELRRHFGDEARKLREVIRQELEARADYQAWSWFTTGKRIVGEGMEGAPAGKLDLAKVQGMKLGAQAERKLKPVMQVNGIDPDVVAPYLGFASGDELVRALADLPAMGKLLESMVTSRMQEKYPGYSASPGWFAEEANKALNNDELATALGAEIGVLHRKVGGENPRTLVAALAIAAKKRVAGMTGFEIEPFRFRKAAQVAGVEKQRAFASGDFAGAAQAARRQLWNLQLARFAQEAKDEIERIRWYLDTFSHLATRKRIGLASQAALQAIDTILEGIEFKRRSDKTIQRRASLAEYLAELEEQGALITIPQELRDQAKLRNYKGLTLDELRGVEAAVANIDTQAGLKGKLLLHGKLRDLERTAEEVAAHIERHVGHRFAEKPGDKQNPGWVERRIEWLRKGRASLTKIEFLLRPLDGGLTAGFLHQLIYQPLRDAEGAKQRLSEKTMEQLMRPLRALTLKDRIRYDQRVDFLGKKMKLSEVIAVALNVGNESNLDKLVGGYAYRGWTREKVLDRLDELLEERDWKLVQHIWDTIDTLWPAIKELSERTVGVAPPRVEARTVYTKHGQFRGGYFPVVYDRKKLAKAWKTKEGKTVAGRTPEEQAQAKEVWQGNNFLMPYVSKGFTEARTKYEAPLLLSLDLVPSHINEVIHYLTYYEAVTNVDKLLQHPTVVRAFHEGVGQEMQLLFRPWLQAIAKDGSLHPVQDGIDTALRHLRLGSSIVMLGAKWTTGLMQAFGFLPTMKEIGPKYLALGVKEFMAGLSEGNPFKAAEDASAEQRHLVKHFDREIGNLFDASVSSFGLGKLAQRRVGEFSLALIIQVQRTVNAITWYGAHQKALEENHANPVGYADSIVAMTQSSGGMVDMAAIQQGSETKKLFVVMYTYYSVLFNQLAEGMGKKTSGQKVATMAARWWWMIFLPVLLEALLRNKEPEPKDEESWTKFLARENLLYAGRSIPLVGSLGDAFLGDLRVRTAPWLDSMLRAARGAGHGIDPSKDMTKADARAIGEFAGMVLHIPTGGMMNAARYLEAYSSGQLQEPVRDLLFRSPQTWE